VVDVGSDPLDTDTDNDGIPDGADVEFVKAILSDQPITAFDPVSHKGVMLNSLDEAEPNIQFSILLDAAGQPGPSEVVEAMAIDQLNNIRNQMNGCPAGPDQNDKIIDCAVQLEVREVLDLLIANLSAL
jgi:hypothetical protein